MQSLQVCNSKRGMIFLKMTRQNRSISKEIKLYNKGVHAVIFIKPEQLVMLLIIFIRCWGLDFPFSSSQISPPPP